MFQLIPQNAPPQQRLAVFGSGIGMALLLWFSSTTQLAGIISTFIPVLPLFLIGFALGFQASVLTFLTATAVSALLMDGQALLLLTLTQSLPSLYYVQRFLLSRPGKPGQDGTLAVEWYPQTHIILHLSLYAAGLYILFALIAPEDQGIQAMIADIWKEMVQTAYPEEFQAQLTATQGMLFMFPAMIMWWWIGMLVLIALIAHMLLKVNQKLIRPDFTITPVFLPLWAMVLTAGSGLAIIFTAGDAEFVAKSLMIMLLLPYFVTGMARIHALVRAKQGGILVLFLIYVLILLFLPLSALLVALYNLGSHLGQFMRSGGASEK